MISIPALLTLAEVVIISYLQFVEKDLEIKQPIIQLKEVLKFLISKPCDNPIQTTSRLDLG